MGCSVTRGEQLNLLIIHLSIGPSSHPHGKVESRWVKAVLRKLVKAVLRKLEKIGQLCVR